MSFLKRAKGNEEEGALKTINAAIRTATTTNNKKPSPLIIGLIAAVVASAGFIAALAVLAPQQLAEAATTATDVICDKCVGTTDIADNAVTSTKIYNGQVKNGDLGSNAVTTGKIADGQVYSSDIADVTIGSSDIADSAVTSSKLAGGAVKPNVHSVRGSLTEIAPGTTGSALTDCPAGEVVTGGGYAAPNSGLQFYANSPWDVNTWFVGARNEARGDLSFYPYALCEGAFP